MEQVTTVSAFHALQFRLLGNDLESLFLPSAIVFVEGDADILKQILVNLVKNAVEALGASGAISGVMGAYMVLYPRERILTLVFIFVVPIPAVFILGYWFLLQFLAGIDALGTSAKGGVAVWAHVGGFLLGVLLTQVVRRR